MAISNRERVGRILELLRKGLQPFVERELAAVYGEAWREKVAENVPGPKGEIPGKTVTLDTYTLLKVMWNLWHQVFGKTLGQSERTLVSELLTVRNRWAHDESFSLDDAYRTADSVERLLKAISSPEAEEAERHKQEILSIRYEQHVRKVHKEAARAGLAGQPQAGLKPWREVVTPHPDVASGRYQQAEFAADLFKVHKGEAAGEYQDPREFYRRTFLTEGLRSLLIGGLRRLAGKDGDPVVQLQTNFGGGKTHSLLALYHLFSGTPVEELTGVDALVRAAEAEPPAEVRRVVLDGQRISPGQPSVKPDGTQVRTLWGELAWQLGGREAYDMIREADERATNPGEALEHLIRRYSPCLILIDEWVAYARQLYDRTDLPAGSWDTQFTFAQALTEAVKGVPNALLVVSVPSSDIEIGGEGGKHALERLKNVIGRLDSPWRPASAEEGFEIVRRRLFEDIADPDALRARDAVCRAFTELYRKNAADFPPECREPGYEDRMKSAYPIHPVLFDFLHNEWSTLDKFQRTRGVLRLMAAVIHSLWEREDRSLIILPASVPIDTPFVQSELCRYLEDNWPPILETDVDGPGSLPLRLDGANPNFGRYSACRRVTRSIFLGSAPTIRGPNRGVEVRHIKLSVVQPGESVATFGDALRHISSEATYLYMDKDRYWFDTRATVSSTATQMAERMPPDRVVEAIHDWVRKELKGSRGPFARVHPFPQSGEEVPDEREVRLVVLSARQAHAAKSGETPALLAAKEILENRSGGPRTYRNTLVFLAADSRRLGEVTKPLVEGRIAGDLEQAVRQYLAWDTIWEEREKLNLDLAQVKLTQKKRQEAEEMIHQRIPEAYCWLLVPTQPEPAGEIEWREIRLRGGGRLVERAAQRLENEQLLMTSLGPAILRMVVDRIPLWRGDHVSLQQLAEDFATYLYLYRLSKPELIREAVEQGVALINWEQDGFAYADAWDEKESRYRGLRMGESCPVRMSGLIVRPEVALDHSGGEGTDGDGQDGRGPGGEGGVTVEKKKKTRFHASIKLNPLRLGTEADTVRQEVLRHLLDLANVQPEVRLEIQIRVPDGIPDSVARIVKENCQALRFENWGIEEE
jgi:hypothetical protein